MIFAILCVFQANIVDLKKRKKADRGNVESLSILGQFYMYGVHVEKNFTKALHFFREAERGVSFILLFLLKKRQKFYKKITTKTK